MSQVPSFTENRNQIDNTMMFLVQEVRGVVCELVRPLEEQGRFSMSDIPAESRGNLRTVDDIAQTMDPSALLAVLMQCLSDTGPGLEIEGVNFALVDKVRRIRNDHAHGRGNYSDPVYMEDSMNALGTLWQNLVAAGEKIGVPGIESLDLRNRKERTERFHRAYSQGRFAAAIAAARQGISQDADAQTGMTPLQMAITHNLPTVVTGLLEGGADPNVVLRSDDTPLGLAVRSDRAVVVQALLAAGADPNAALSSGDTPLSLAVRSDNAVVVQALLTAGADPQLHSWLRIRPGLSAPNPLHLAVRLGKVKALRSLLSDGVDINGACVKCCGNSFQAI